MSVDESDRRVGFHQGGGSSERARTSRSSARQQDDVVRIRLSPARRCRWRCDPCSARVPSRRIRGRPGPGRRPRRPAVGRGVIDDDDLELDLGPGPGRCATAPAQVVAVVVAGDDHRHRRRTHQWTRAGRGDVIRVGLRPRCRGVEGRVSSGEVISLAREVLVLRAPEAGSRYRLASAPQCDRRPEVVLKGQPCAS